MNSYCTSHGAVVLLAADVPPPAVEGGYLSDVVQVLALKNGEMGPSVGSYSYHSKRWLVGNLGRVVYWVVPVNKTGQP
jgi:hypothetical protein